MIYCNKRPIDILKNALNSMGLFYASWFILFKQLAHTLILFGVPFSSIRILLRLGAQDFGDFLCEWLTFLPNNFPLPQISHTCAIGDTPPYD